MILMSYDTDIDGFIMIFMLYDTGRTHQLVLHEIIAVFSKISVSYSMIGMIIMIAMILMLYDTDLLSIIAIKQVS